jgi:hypothetical protein
VKNPNLPVHIVMIVYKGRSLEAAKKKQPKGEKTEAELTGCTRFLYVYEHESLDERMQKAWREDAEATVFSATYKKAHQVKASATKGIWS